MSVVTTLLLMFAFAGGPSATTTAPTETKPEFAEFDLESYKGKVVVTQLVASWCGACRTTVPALNRWTTTYADKGVEVVRVSKEKASLIRRLVSRDKFAGKTLTDPRGELHAAANVTAFPTWIVFDRNGDAAFVDAGAGWMVDKVEDAIKKAVGTTPSK